MNDDRWLKELLDEEPLPDDGFTRSVMARVERQERLRRFLLLAVTLGSGAVALWLAGPIDLAWIPEIQWTAWHVLTLLVGVGVGGAFWVDTEPLRVG